ncbi:MAG: translation initiation factor IF-2 [Flavobacteriales bacterium]|nr:translation initiation factor IF-2 [Flavobacteriales bacterium]
MSGVSQRLSKVAKEFNVGVDTILDFLESKGIDNLNRNSKISPETYEVLVDEYQPDKKVKAEAKELKKAEDDLKPKVKKEIETVRVETPKIEGLKIVSKVDINPSKTVELEVKDKEEEVEPEKIEAPVVEKVAAEQPLKAEEPKVAEEVKDEPKESVPPTKKKEAKVSEEKKTDESSIIRGRAKKLDGPTLVSSEKIDLTKFQKPKKKTPVASSSANVETKKKRKRVSTGGNRDRRPNRGKQNTTPRVELTPEQIQKQVRENLAKLQSGGKNKGAKLRREKRQARKEQEEINLIKSEEESKTIQVTEFVTTAEFAQLMSVEPTQIISACFSLGMMVTQNQRLDAETLSIVAEEFGFTVEFVGAEVQESIQQEEDIEENLVSRAPIVTVMGHVDHGKTSLLDYIRDANVISGEAGGITQHVGAYEVNLKGKKITFLDTPGHEAFTAMRARGAQVTDVVIIVVAADDKVMPQTKEAISHAQAAGVPMVFALNKIDRETANPDKIKEQLANENVLLEDWGGKFQSQEISAKTGLGIPELLEKVLLEAELLDLKANPEKNAIGTVIEASLDKGKGYLTTILVESGTLKVGDYVLAGCFSGKVKALLDERENKMENAGPSTPAVLLGLNGAAQAGDKFNVMDDEREAKNIAAKRMQLQREQGVRTQKHITLDEIGRRLALGDFKELNIIIKGDVDGSIEALSDSLQKLSTDQIAVNIIHKSVGQISESDVMLAAASDAVIIGFQVRPSVNARKLAEKEQIDIRLYSVIYNAIEELEKAMEGMLSPDIEEKVVCNIEIRETFKISKIGTIAGCYVLDGKINRNTKIRLIRDGIVVYSGELATLKRFKDDVKEVSAGYECGLSINNFNDIKVGDIVEGFEEVEVKKTLQ